MDPCIRRDDANRAGMMALGAGMSGPVSSSSRMRGSIFLFWRRLKKQESIRESDCALCEDRLPQGLYRSALGLHCPWADLGGLFVEAGVVLHAAQFAVGVGGLLTNAGG